MTAQTALVGGRKRAGASGDVWPSAWIANQDVEHHGCDNLGWINRPHTARPPQGSGAFPLLRPSRRKFAEGEHARRSSKVDNSEGRPRQPIQTLLPATQIS